MKRTALVLVVVGALAGCTTYAHRSMHNAPGVTDLSTPPAREVGDPSAYTPPEQPGSETIAVWAMPNVVLGSGRLDVGQVVTELGMSFRVERVVDANGALLHKSAFAITAGVGLAQFYETRPTIFGATFVELNYRNLIKVIPFDVALGAAVYPGVSLAATGEHYDASIGGQLSVRIPLALLRFRYMTETGFEVMAGYELPFPFFFGRSR